MKLAILREGTLALLDKTFKIFPREAVKNALVFTVKFFIEFSPEEIIPWYSWEHKSAGLVCCQRSEKTVSRLSRLRFSQKPNKHFFFYE
jgi:hypothetical protein